MADLYSYYEDPNHNELSGESSGVATVMPSQLRSGRWQARIRTYNIETYLGVHDTYEQAQQAEQAYRKKYHQELITEGLNKSVNGTPRPYNLVKRRKHVEA